MFTAALCEYSPVFAKTELGTETADLLEGGPHHSLNEFKMLQSSRNPKQENLVMERSDPSVGKVCCEECKSRNSFSIHLETIILLFEIRRQSKNAINLRSAQEPTTNDSCGC